MTNQLTPKMIEAALQAQCDAPGLRWSDGVSEGMQIVWRAKMERALEAAFAMSRLSQPEGTGVGAFPLNVGDLLERMTAQIEEWDADEPRDMWWGYQQDYLTAMEYLQVVNEGGPVLAMPETAAEPISPPLDSEAVETLRSLKLLLSDDCIRGDDLFGAREIIDRALLSLAEPVGGEK